MAGKYSDFFPEWVQPHSQFPVNPSGIEDENEVGQLLLQHRYLSECMGGVLPAALDLSHVKRALDAPCGASGWVYELAWYHPSMHVTGIDGRPAYVEKARELVNLLGNATVTQQDIQQLSDEVVPLSRGWDPHHALCVPYPLSLPRETLPYLHSCAARLLTDQLYWTRTESILWLLLKERGFS